MPVEDKTLVETHNSVEKIVNELTATTSRCSLIINGLENNESFNMLLDDFKKQREIIDNNWHLIDDPLKLNQLRITKFAALSLINSLDNYKHDLHKAQQTLAEIQAPDKVQGSYYDHE